MIQLLVPLLKSGFITRFAPPPPWYTCTSSIRHSPLPRIITCTSLKVPWPLSTVPLSRSTVTHWDLSVSSLSVQFGAKRLSLLGSINSRLLPPPSDHLPQRPPSS